MSEQLRNRVRPVLVLLLACTTVFECGRTSSAQPDAELAAVHARFGGAAIHWLLQRQVGGEKIECGYVGAPPEAFIARSGRVWQASDLPGGEFGRWQDQFCGPDWVKPLPMPPAPT